MATTEKLTEHRITRHRHEIRWRHLTVTTVTQSSKGSTSRR